MRLAAPVLALALLTPAAALAGGGTPDFILQAPPFGYGAQGFVFPSGLQILIQEDTSAPMVAVATVIDAGDVDDPDGKQGTARLAEHLWYQSRHGDAPRVQDRLYQLGATHDAMTRPDFTMHFTAGPIESLRGILTLESERLTDAMAGVGEPQLAAARELVRYEPLLTGGDPLDIALPHLYSRLFTDDFAYAKLEPVGPELDGITVADVSAFTKERYTPANTTIVIVSSLDPRKVLDQVYWVMEPSLFHPDLTRDDFQSYLAIDYDGDPGAADPENPDHMSIRPKDPNDPDAELFVDGERPVRLPGEGEPPETPPGFTKEAIVIEAPVEHPTAVVAWAVPAAFRGNDYLLNVAAGTLTGIVRPYYSDLPDLVTDPSTGKPSVECRVDGLPEASVIACYAEMRPRSNADSVTDGILNQVSQLWNPDMQHTLENTYYDGRFNALTRDLHDTEDFSDPRDGRASKLARHVHFSGSVTMAGDMIRSILDSTGAQVSAFAVDYLDRKRAVKLALIPSPAAAGLASLGAGSGTSMLAGSIQAEPDPEAITADAIKAAFHGPNLDDVVEKTLDNGLRVVLVPHGESPLVSATLVAKGGRNTGEPGLDDYLEGVAKAFPHGDLYEGPNQDPIKVAGEWDIDVLSTYSYATLKASGGNVDDVLYKLRRMVDTRTVGTELRARTLKSMGEKVNSRWQSSTYWANKLQYDRLTPGWALAQYPDHVALEGFKDLGVGDIKAGLDAKYQPSNMVLVVVGGSLDTEATLEQATTRFGDWKVNAGAPPAAPAPAGAPTGSGTFVLDVGTPQAYLDMSCQFPAWTPETAPSQAVAAQIVGAMLRDALLEDGTLVYQAGASPQLYAGGTGLLAVNAVVDNASAGATLKRMQDIAAKVAAGEADPTDVGAQALHLAQGYAMAFQTLDQMRDALAALTTDPNRGMGFYDAYGPAIGDVTPASIGEQLTACLANTVTTVSGDAAKASASLDAAGISYETFDWRAEGDALIEAQDPKTYKKLLKDRAKGK